MIKLDQRQLVRQLILLGLFLVVVKASEMGGMLMDEIDTDRDLSIYIQHATRDSIHWVISAFMLLVLPSLTCAFSFSERYILSSNLSILSSVYALIEAVFLRFNDPDGHENRTSRGTAWFLLILSATCTFFGLLSSGSKFIGPDNIFRKYGENIITRIFKVLTLLCVITGWIKTCLSVIALLGFCYWTDSNHTGQCLAHGIMGSAFVIYGFIMLLWVSIPWMRNSNGKYPPEFYDSIIITIWGFINTFTEHRPWEPWSHGDYQHTAMGIVWFGMGICGIYLSKNGKRSFIPALVIIITGWSMSVHVQHLIISTKVHFFFGLSLMMGGIARLIEVCFLLKDERNQPGTIYSFQYFAPFSLVEAGILFMSANEEQLILVKDMGADHAAYIMLITCGAFFVNFWLVAVIDLYLRLVGVDKYSGKLLNSISYTDIEHNQVVNQHDIEQQETFVYADDYELDSLSENDADSRSHSHND